LQNFDDCCRGTLVMLAACGIPETASATPDTIPANVPTTHSETATNNPGTNGKRFVLGVSSYGDGEAGGSPPQQTRWLFKPKQQKFFVGN
jgi:hypothetical protein